VRDHPDDVAEIKKEHAERERKKPVTWSRTRLPARCSSAQMGWRAQRAHLRLEGVQRKGLASGGGVSLGRSTSMARCPAAASGRPGLARRPAGLRCSTCPPATLARPVIARRSMRLSAVGRRPERRSNDGQMILKVLSPIRNSNLTW
jgi:hypothetical protein